MSEGDVEHFEEYPNQTRLKHEILRAYLWSLFHILKGRHRQLNHIDGFAGKGTYADRDEVVPGSPLVALKLIAAEAGFAMRVKTAFIEKHRDLFPKLAAGVQQFYQEHPEIHEPILRHGEFAKEVPSVLHEMGRAPTFLFVDPKGITGVSFDVIRRVVSAPASEALIFFNSRAVTRVARLPAQSETLVELFGSAERASKLVEGLTGIASPDERDAFVIQSYRHAIIEDMDAKYVIAFRVEYKDRRSTSHYFVHVTKHPLGFELMKEIMWKKGRSDQGPGGLEYIQASDIQMLFQIEWGDLRKRIIEALRSGMAQVRTFTKTWVRDPEDTYSWSAYKQALIELEKGEQLEVLAKDGVTKRPAEKRMRKGRVTLGDDCFVRLPES